ncbi:MAG: acylphosphatase [Candidatus Omnitrophota bacterium]
MVKKRLHVFYDGNVQGVGFRFTAVDIAQQLGLAGWVRNLHDGRVEVICEGEEDLLKKFLAHIKDSMRGYIQREDVEFSDATGEYKDFRISW